MALALRCCEPHYSMSYHLRVEYGSCKCHCIKRSLWSNHPYLSAIEQQPGQLPFSIYFDGFNDILPQYYPIFIALKWNCPKMKGLEPRHGESWSVNSTLWSGIVITHMIFHIFSSQYPAPAIRWWWYSEMLSLCAFIAIWFLSNQKLNEGNGAEILNQ